MNYRLLDTVRDFLQLNKKSTILSAVIAIGWFYGFLQVAAITPGGNLSRFGPGVDTLTLSSSQPTNAMSNLISSIPLCSGFGLSWTLENFRGSILMWFSMVLAMMVLTLLAPSVLRPDKVNSIIRFLFGYVFISGSFFVFLQWQSNGVCKPPRF